MVDKKELERYIPESCRDLHDKSNSELRSEIPELARDWERMVDIEEAVYSLPSNHEFYKSDARNIDKVTNESVHLVVTSPPYFNLKDYNDESDQLGSINDYEQFTSELADAWKEIYNKLIPGGRMCVVVGDILQSRREAGRHRALPLHSTIQEQCRDLGFDCLAPIIWAKIGNASLEAGGNARFLGKPYEPGAVIKNDIEYILMFKKPGEYRSPCTAERILSTIQVDEHKEYFQQIWTNINGARSDKHPAPYPKELAKRLIKMYSFVGDSVLDPFGGIGTTTLAAAELGRDSICVDIDEEYLNTAERSLKDQKQQQTL